MYFGPGSGVGLACDGRVQIAGVYADTTKVRATASADSALALVNGLLALNFFDLPETYQAKSWRREAHT